MPGDEKDKEILFLRERVKQLQDQLSFFQKQFVKESKRPRFNISERLFVIFQMEYLQLPRRRVTEYFGVARSTLYRWLHRIDDPEPKTLPPTNKRQPTSPHWSGRSLRTMSIGEGSESPTSSSYSVFS